MLDQNDDDQQDDKEILEQTHIHSYRLYEITWTAEKYRWINRTLRIIKIYNWIQEIVRNLSLNTPQQY